MNRRKKKAPLNLDHDPGQEATRQDYARSSTLGFDKGLIDNLHAFFSPNRIPMGLTDDEALTCALLYPYRKQQHQKLIDLAWDADPEVLLMKKARVIMSLPPLPSEFSPDKPMTRKRFREGLRKVLRQMNQTS